MKQRILHKSFYVLLCSLGINAMAQNKVEFKSLYQIGQSVVGITNDGYAQLYGANYDYKTSKLIPKESHIKNFVSMNENGDVLAVGTLNGVVQTIFKLHGTTEWQATTIPTAAKPYAISNNGRYIVGQMSPDAFLYDTQTKEYVNLSSKQYKYGAAYIVNNDGVAAGWVDKGEGSTKRELAIMKSPTDIKIILAAQTLVGTQEIRGLSDEGIATGKVGPKPFIYNINTDEYKILDLPAGTTSGILGYSNNGISVGFVQSIPDDREAIVYHESLGNKPKKLRDILEEQGVENPMPNKNTGMANVISQNGDFIGGVEVGGAAAPGWIFKLNGYFDKKACNITAPVEIEKFLTPGETSAKVTYDVTSDCSTNKLVLVKGYASGSDFPIGTTQVLYNLVNDKNEVIDTKSFKVYVRDYFCTPSYKGGTEPITRVKFGDLDNKSSADITTNQNEYFFDKVTDIVKGETYEISVEGNTNGPEMDQIAVYFDWDQNNTYNPDVEGYFVGKITNSTGTDGQVAKMNIPIPADIKEGKIRMRVMKAFKVEPNNPCSVSYAYGQTEDYLINIVKEKLGVSDVSKNTLKIAPNPVKDILIIQSSTKVKSVRITNLAGQTVLNQQINKTNPHLNVANLSKGVYIIAIETSEGISTQKIIKD